MQATYLAHHGVKGMKWGVRRFQNKDGSLTSVGKRRYGHESQKNGQKDAQQTSANDTQKKGMSTGKKVAIGAAAVAGVALAAYGAKKYVDYKNSSAGKASRALGEAQAKQVFDKRAAEVAMLRGMRSPAPAPRTYSQADVNRVMGKKAIYSGNIKASPKLRADQGVKNLKANGIDARRLEAQRLEQRIERLSKERSKARGWKPRSSTTYINPYGGMSLEEAREYQDWLDRH